MKTNARTASFLQALNMPGPVSAKAREASVPPMPPVEDPAPAAQIEIPRARTTREGKKHIGAYFDQIDDAELLEQFALLRARLRLDNAGLMRLMIGETFRKMEAKKAFGDA